MNRYKTLFEQQSYNDALNYYMETLKKENLSVWDYVVLTASNEAQASVYRLQIEYRQARNQLPKATKFVIIPDLGGKRIGSGGATFSVIRYIRENEETFKGKKILCIHSGGDSKRVPQYSACGKLFSPVPRVLPNGRRSTLFDEFMIAMSTVATRISEGMLVCSGDVLLLFNALQIDFYGAGAAALSVKEKVETGKNHGVYLKDQDGNVGSFLHKQTIETLDSCGAVDERRNVDIDTGAVILSADMLEDLYELVKNNADYLSFANDKARVSFYADFLYPLASGSTIEQYYKEKSEGELTEELHNCRTKLWNTLHKYRMKLIRLSPASFIHFGTTKELLNLMTDDIEQYSFLGWNPVVNSNILPEHYAVSNSFISSASNIGEGSYIEDSRIYEGTKIGKRCVISAVTIKGKTVPDNTVLHGLKLKDGRFVVRKYGIDDNPKENSWMGKKIDAPLWESSVFPICDTMEEAVFRVLSDDIEGCDMISLKDSFNLADETAILPWQENLYEQIIAESILEDIKASKPVEEVRKKHAIIGEKTIEYLLKRAEDLKYEKMEEFGLLIRICSYLSQLTEGQFSDEMSQKCFKTICDATTYGIEYETNQDKISFKKDETVVKLPVRVNWGGGWSDTPPYCLENGGTVLNAAISINGELPIEVTIRKIDEPCIILESTDIGSKKCFMSISEILDCRNPSDPAALHKAALIACGLIPQNKEIVFSELISQLGGGIYMNTRVNNIPKGSGLGTSSILSVACVKAISEAFGFNWTDSDLYERALCMEQIMSTGGGWQDQVGGISGGIKLITTEPGLRQKIVCTPCKISEDTLKELNERFCIIYTGQRRLARNLLRDVITKYMCNNAESLEAHKNIQEIAVQMCEKLEKGDIDSFAALLNAHWEESKRIDSESTNTCIEQMFIAIDEMIDGRMICGAGGGGFLQVVLKKGIKKEQLRARLHDVFQDSGIDIWDCQIIMNIEDCKNKM